MKTKFGMQALGLLLVVALAGAIFVPAVSAEEEVLSQNCPDKVDEKTLLDRTPPLLVELKNKGYSESEIANYLLKLPKNNKKGWSEKDNERALSYFRNYEQSESKTYDVQKDGRMVINAEDFQGINGYMRPGDLEVSTGGTECHYFTSHIGADGEWIEVGVARFFDSSNEYFVYTYDSTRPSGQERKTWGTTNPNQDHNFMIYIYDDYDGQGYPYAIWWDNTCIDSGHFPYYYNNPDENHEIFASSINNFQSCSVGYFEDSFLYKKEGNDYNAYWWNSDLPITEWTESYGIPPVQVDRYIPQGSNSYKIESWI